MIIELAIPSFIAGILTFLAPCTFPMVPAYLSLITGGLGQKISRKKTVINGLLFVIGFTAIFTLFGTLIGLIGSALVPYRVWLTRLGGLFIILFGLFMLGAFRLKWFNVEKRLTPPAVFKPGSKLNSLFIGLAFGFGWTPCVGPLLGSILLLASNSATAVSGATLLFIFSIGMAVPFMLVALGVGSLEEWLTPHLGKISKIGGVFLILLGLLLITNNFSLLIAYGYELFGFLEYDRILNYL